MTALGERPLARHVSPSPRSGRYRYTVMAWVDPFLSWRHDFARRVDAEDLRVAAQVGAELIKAAAQRASGEDRTQLATWAAQLREPRRRARPARARARRGPGEPSRRAIRIAVSRPRFRPSFRSSSIASARAFPPGTSCFPAPAARMPGTHGTLRDCEARLPYVAQMGFDVLYLPPIHPIGRERRKGRNNALATDGRGRRQPLGDRRCRRRPQGDPSAARHARRLSPAGRRARARSGSKSRSTSRSSARPTIRTCATHPRGFAGGPDGTVQYAENPPKKYQDIYPFNFETEDWAGLWRELAGVFEFWIGEGVRIFRVDNPHTKPFAVLGMGDRRGSSASTRT